MKVQILEESFAELQAVTALDLQEKSLETKFAHQSSTIPISLTNSSQEKGLSILHSLVASGVILLDLNSSETKDNSQMEHLAALTLTVSVVSAWHFLVITKHLSSNLRTAQELKDVVFTNGKNGLPGQNVVYHVALAVGKFVKGNAHLVGNVKVFLRKVGHVKACFVIVKNLENGRNGDPAVKNVLLEFRKDSGHA